jgi:pilus assembly protein CpaB
MARLRGFIWLAAGLVVAALAGIVAFVTLSTAAPMEGDQPMVSPPSVSVVVAARRVEVRSLLTAEDLELRDIPVDAVPETALRDVEDGVGRITMVDLYPGEILLDQRVLDPDVLAADGRTAVLINDDQVLMAFPAGDLMSQLNVLKRGDHVDLLVTMNLPPDALTEAPGVVRAEGEGTEPTTFSLLQNVIVSQIMRGGEEGEGGARAFLFTVDPQDALLLKYVKDTDGTMDVVLRAPGVEGEFELFPVELDYLINRYQVPEGAAP